MRLRGKGAAALVATLAAAFSVHAQVPTSLDQVPIPEPNRAGIAGKIQGGTHDLAEIIPTQAARDAAVRLGKALFWDVQVGSANDVGCATCHFKAGTDGRVVNTLHPGAGGAFEVAPPNRALRAEDFPFHRLADPADRLSALLFDSDDVVGAQGVPLAAFENIREGGAADRGTPQTDRLFQSQRRNVRQVTGRNTPSAINAIFNFTNFHDGRANHFFNGVNPFGPQDPDARVWVDDGDGLRQELMLLNNASLASQAVGPPLNGVEMSWTGRTFPALGRKLLDLTPLARQVVHRDDSRLGLLSRARLTGNPQARGLATTYRQMIREAFAPRFWQSTQPVGGFSQIEANFSLFFGLALQMYQATLVSDDTPFDRFLRGDPTALSNRQLTGLNIFFSGRTRCADCHVGPELTAAAITQILDPAEAGLVEVMAMGDGQNANYDIGFYNIGVRPTAEDLGRGGVTPFGNPLSFSRQAVMKAGLLEGSPEIGFLNFDDRFVPAPGCVPDPFADPPRLCPPVIIPRAAADGAFKVPSLRNVELTGPYFHNGGYLTLKQTVEFYDRGGDFHEANLANLDPVIQRIGLAEVEEEALIDFLVSLTDERVRWERAPFDHPELPMPAGHRLTPDRNPKRHGGAPLATTYEVLPPVGASGRAAEGLGPLTPFLWDGTPDFHWR